MNCIYRGNELQSAIYFVREQKTKTGRGTALKTLKQMKEWYISAVKSVLILNFGLQDDEAMKYIEAYGLRERIDKDPEGQLSDNIEGVAEDIARKEFAGRPSSLYYKGYYTEIRYDSVIRHLYGKICGINDFISFEADPSQDIEQEFHRAVDEYLEYCSISSKTPEKGSEDIFGEGTDPEAAWKMRHQIKTPKPAPAPLAKEKVPGIVPDAGMALREETDEKTSQKMSDADFLRMFGMDPDEAYNDISAPGPRSFSDADALGSEGEAGTKDVRGTHPEGKMVRVDRLEYETGLTREEISAMGDKEFLSFMGIDPDDVIL